MRMPFLATDRGTTSNTTRSFFQVLRSSTWARTIVVTSNIKLDRMLLHSRATSTVRPGIDTRTPVRDTGTPTAEKSSDAAIADPCCSDWTILSSRNAGIGTSRNRKQRGKSSRRAAFVPKQITNAASHRTTKAAIPAAKRTSAAGQPDHHLLNAAIRPPAANKYMPALDLAEETDASESHSDKIKAALIGRIRMMCVYESSCRARDSVLVMEPHRIAIERRHSAPKIICRDNDRDRGSIRSYIYLQLCSCVAVVKNRKSRAIVIAPRKLRLPAGLRASHVSLHSCLTCSRNPTKVLRRELGERAWSSCGGHLCAFFKRLRPLTDISPSPKNNAIAQPIMWPHARYALSSTAVVAEHRMPDVHSETSQLRFE